MDLYTCCCEVSIIMREVYVRRMFQDISLFIMIMCNTIFIHSGVLGTPSLQVNDALYVDNVKGEAH